MPAPRPALIGVAYELARLTSIRPQPHDIPMDHVVTERGAFRREAGKLAAMY
jgi:5-formyltetrahydrofolate cyclo-ligase